MHLPQELVNEIVAYIKHGKNLKILLNLLQASSTVFSPQICLNLHHLPIHIETADDYSLLSSISSLSADILPSLRILTIEEAPDIRLQEPRIQHLPSLLDGCTGIQALSIRPCETDWSLAFPEQHRRAIYRAIQRPTLVSLSLAWAHFGHSDITEFGGLTLPPSLRKITLYCVSVAHESHFATQPAHPDGGAPGIEELRTDDISVPFARLMFRPPHPYPYRNLRTLSFNTYGRETSSQTANPSAVLLHANPHLEYLLLGTEAHNIPTHDLSKNTALKTLVISFYVSGMVFSVVNIAAMLNTFSRSNILERVFVSGISNNTMIEAEAEHWQALDVVLASKIHFPALLGVELDFCQVVVDRRPSDGHDVPEYMRCTPNIERLMRGTLERGVLDIREEFVD
ncbi:hypothetical protein BD626DRAFT_510266 [Schizophyllum amplum]|uniref:F-box domain-containing protein n=1 Tax=Schizophyllum amplum TaxID=97359 RepID=A0A550C2D6_9AGAR|nr:hypothetical protein BD626DRAFT_510266 [Auriculariopsis ampla]